MTSINEMNDWAEYQERLKQDMDRQVTSNKALLWTGIAVNGVFTLIALTIAVVALIHALMLGRDNLALQKEISECKASVIALEQECDDAKKAYGTARAYVSRYVKDRKSK